MTENGDKRSSHCSVFYSRLGAKNRSDNEIDKEAEWAQGSCFGFQNSILYWNQIYMNFRTQPTAWLSSKKLSKVGGVWEYGVNEIDQS